MVTFLGASVKEYLERYGKKSPEFNFPCPICGNCRPHRHGHYERWAVDSNSEQRIPIYRYECQSQGHEERTISLLPDFLWPFRSFMASFIERAICVRVEDSLSWGELLNMFNPHSHVVSLKTLKRWIRVISSRAQKVTTDLFNLLLNVFPGLKLPPQKLTSRTEFAVKVLLSLVRFLCRALSLTLKNTYFTSLPAFSLIHRMFGAKALL
ncbi:DUF6431 domain-containing protein [Desulfotomaculum nigrificans]|uniref:DUF6431 domain-containing protein n=1 Tax=Desulfotomaculum nigrificans TaxID=1565 RepID=UPI001FA73B52|nr:DUF6431 domain-containing protein [Desulfotomaculum nigrificans]